jgi:HTH-type transcriptional regulator / antitoxin HigA
MKINSEKELDEALDIIDKIISKGEITDEEDNYINDLAEAIEAYEDIHYPMGKSTPASMICFLMDQHSLDNAKLALESGIPEADVVSLKTGQRIPTSAEADLLGKRFHCDSSLFVEE